MVGSDVSNVGSATPLIGSIAALIQLPGMRFVGIDGEYDDDEDGDEHGAGNDDAGTADKGKGNVADADDGVYGDDDDEVVFNDDGFALGGNTAVP